MKKVKRFDLIQKNESELVDTIGDFLETAAVVENRLSDGFQIPDIFKIAEQEDEVRDAINSFPQFLDEFKEINPDLARMAVDKAEERAIEKAGPLGKVSKFIVGLLRNVSSNYGFLQKTVEEGKKELLAWKELFGNSKRDFATS